MDKYDELLTAKSWIIMNFQTGSYMRGSNVDKKRQIASLTKMYTLYGCLLINKQINMNPQKTFVKVVDILSTGTTADLVVGKYILLKDLYYAMMLPSGNDAAALLGFYYGYWLDKQGIFPNLIFSKARKVDLKEKIKYCNLLTKRFMQFLNDTVIKKELNHKNTKLQNPQGLSNKHQVSTAWEISEAAICFMKNSKVLFLQLKQFRQIVKTKTHSGFYFNDVLQQSEPFEWKNTNILLHEEGFEGVKTGQTTTAGSCLCSYKTVLIKNKHQYEFLIVVLGCSNSQRRFVQTRIICDDLQKHLQVISY